MAELAERGEGRRESGAFLLGPVQGDGQTVTEVAYYDDLAPGCLAGDIRFPPEGFTRLWALCREGELRVLADSHTHSGRWVGQSGTDRRNPMVAERGHLALIVPNFARGNVRARDLGVHEYLGSHLWNSCFKRDAARLVRITLL